MGHIGAISVSGFRSMVRATLVVVVGLVLVPSAHSETLEERLKPLIEAHEGQVAVAVKHLDTGESFVHRADVPMPSASLVKFPVMIETYRQARDGRIDLAKPVVLREEDKVPGSGILTAHFSAGASFPLRDAVRLMIAFSDNTATNLVLDQIGLATTAKCMEELGCPNTKIHAKVFRRETSIFPERSKEFGLGSTTAAEMLRLLELLNQRKLVGPEADEKMRQHLLACDDPRKFPKFLPPGTKLAHKTGSVDGVRTDAGIIETPRGPVALCVLTNENKDTRWADDNAGDLLCARIAEAVYRHFNPPDTRTDPNGGAEDDDEPDVRPGPPAELKPRDSLAGPPFVSCRTWAIAEAQSGKVLWESQASRVVDTASTTKIMTAYVVLRLAEKQPDLLDEIVVFSERADKTDGSSCGLRAGERLPARELLFGLLVRSGNDAAIALAEHFGSRFDPPSRKTGNADAVSRFVAEMNREAARLKLSDTRYLNPNGLPEKGHVSSARDLARLTWAARQFPVFRECVASRQHDAQVVGRDGSKRSIVWKTTNRLLAIAGYTGVKTGYTKAAGSCLVSTGERNGDGLIVVVLGAPSAASAVSDSRNLYRWAWRERGHRE